MWISLVIRCKIKLIIAIGKIFRQLKWPKTMIVAEVFVFIDVSQCQTMLFLTYVNPKLQFFKLFWIQFARSVEHYVASAVVLWEGYAVANGVKSGHDAYKAVEAEGKACVGWRTILEGVDEEAKLGHGTFGGEAKDIEHFLLKLAVVDTKAAATYLYAIAYKVVGLGTHLLRMLVEQWNVVGIWHGEGVVGGHETLFLIAPLEQWEIDNPKAFKLVLVAQSQTVAHFKTQGTELGAGFVGLVAAKNEYEVAVLGTHLFLYLLHHLRTIELVDA